MTTSEILVLIGCGAIIALVIYFVIRERKAANEDSLPDPYDPRTNPRDKGNPPSSTP